MEISEIPATPRPRLPEWLRVKLPISGTFARTRSLLDELKLHTVCESARCPNHWECWSKGTATFMIAGDRCTRACGFCAVTTVRRLTPGVRHRATYDRSLSVLSKVKQRGGRSVYTKSGLMLGLGETEAELFQAMTDLRRVGCDILTLGQYLQPTRNHLPVVEFGSLATDSVYISYSDVMYTV